MHTIRNCNIDKQLIYNAIMDCFKGKMRRREIYEEISRCLDGRVSPEMIRYAYNSHNVAYTRYIAEMTDVYYKEIMDRRVTFTPIEYQDRFEPSSEKHRLISIQSIKQLIFDYIVVAALEELFVRHFGPYQSASIPGRGQTHVKDAIEHWIHTDKIGTRYYLKTDVVNYFHSIDHTLLYELIYKYVKDETVLYLIRVILNTYEPVGLSIGSYLSQYLANFFMSDVYHEFAEAQLKTRRGLTYNRVAHIVIYMDDILMFFENESNMRKVYKKLNKFIKLKKLALHKTIMREFKYGDFIDIIGFRFYRDHTTIRKRTFLRIAKLKRMIDKYGMNIADAYKFIAYYGIIIATDYNKLFRQYDVKRLIKQAKMKISNADKRMNLDKERYTVGIDIFFV